MTTAPAPSRTKSVLGGVAYALLLFVALAVGTTVGWAKRNPVLGGIITNPIGFLTEDPKPHFGGKSSEVLLILGCDEDRFYRGVKLHGQNIFNKYARSDMMLLTRLDFDKNQITGLSIPRDTECKVPGYPKDILRINAYHERAPKGQENDWTVAAVNYLIPQVHVDKVVVLDFDAIQRLVDLVGGVTVDVPKRMKYTDKAAELYIDLQPGVQKLNGYNAMCFVRYRHDAESDIGRQKRQKDFLTAFKGAVFQNIFRLPEVLTGGQAALNGAFDDDELRALAAFARRVPQEKIRMGMVPVTDGGPAGTLLIDKKALPAALQQYDFLPAGATGAEATQ